MKKILTLLLLCHSWLIFAQVNTEYEIQGIVTYYGQEPIAGASVSLYEKNDSFLNHLTEIYRTKTNYKGEYKLYLENQKNYYIIANAEECFAQEIRIKTNLYPKTDTIHRHITLERKFKLELAGCMFGRPFQFQRLYFLANDYELSSEIMVFLDEIIAFCKGQIKTGIEVQGHCDSQEENPDLLSEMRALMVVKYLIDNGFNPNNIKWKALGNTKPLYKNEKNELEKQENRRVEFSPFYTK